jgi:hypothetical protein
MKSNPMRFICRPEKADPHNAIEHDFKRFIAFGLWVCHQQLMGPGSDNLAATPKDVHQLRKNFLDTVEEGLTYLPEMLAEEGEFVFFPGEEDCGGPMVASKDKPEETIDFQWVFECLNRKNGPALQFILCWGDLEDYEVWLAVDATKDVSHVKLVLKRARALI